MDFNRLKLNLQNNDLEGKKDAQGNTPKGFTIALPSIDEKINYVKKNKGLIKTADNLLSVVQTFGSKKDRKRLIAELDMHKELLQAACKEIGDLKINSEDKLEEKNKKMDTFFQQVKNVSHLLLSLNETDRDKQTTQLMVKIGIFYGRNIQSNTASVSDDKIDPISNFLIRVMQTFPPLLIDHSHRKLGNLYMKFLDIMKKDLTPERLMQVNAFLPPKYWDAFSTTIPSELKKRIEENVVPYSQRPLGLLTPDAFNKVPVLRGNDNRMTKDEIHEQKNVPKPVEISRLKDFKKKNPKKNNRESSHEEILRQLNEEILRQLNIENNERMKRAVDMFKSIASTDSSGPSPEPRADFDLDSDDEFEIKEALERDPSKVASRPGSPIMENVTEKTTEKNKENNDSIPLRQPIPVTNRKK